MARLRELAIGTLVVPHPRAREASVRYTRKGGTSTENVGVGAREDVGHHGARRRAGHEDARGVDAPVLDRIAHHVRDAERVAAGVMRERCVGVHVPTSSAVGRVGVDHDELVRVGEVGVLRAGEVRLCGAGAVVHRNDQRWVGGETRGADVVEANPCWVVSKVTGELLELAGDDIGRQEEEQRLV